MEGETDFSQEFVDTTFKIFFDETASYKLDLGCKSYNHSLGENNTQGPLGEPGVLIFKYACILVYV